MTHAELGQRMVDGGAGIWTAPQWEQYWGLSQPEQEAMATIAQDQTSPGVDGWGKALAVANVIATVAGDIVGLGSGIEAIKSLVNAL